jgi:signal transduction histidine kinase
MGLAKETAHQLGTPITSMLGWVELLKEGDYSPEVVVEMEKDVQRLEKISCKFSQIGATENVQCVDVIKIARGSLSYMRQRISKKAQLVDGTNGLSAFANVNVMLWEWVVENLLKNAIDAIGQKPGTIELLAHKEGNKIFVDVRDTGRGIASKRLYTTIFKHGYTTKSQGWGVGLSLCYRIIRDLFRGRIFVLQSSPAGTTIRVVLTVA